jgi:hypothetical protein
MTGGEGADDGPPTAGRAAIGLQTLGAKVAHCCENVIRAGARAAAANCPAEAVESTQTARPMVA